MIFFRENQKNYLGKNILNQDENKLPNETRFFISIQTIDFFSQMTT